MRTLVIGSNDLGFTDLPWLEAQGVSAAAAHAGYSGSSLAKFVDERIEVQAMPLELALDTLLSRLKLGYRVDGLCLMSCSPYGRSHELIEPLTQLRGLADIDQCFPAIPARVLPVILSDLKHTIAGRAAPAATGNWTTIIGPDSSGPSDIAGALARLPERTFETALGAMRLWSLDLVADLEAGGLIVSRSPDGTLIPRVALRRRAAGGRMHSSAFDPKEAFRAGLPIFALDLDLDCEPAAALDVLLNDEVYRKYAKKDHTKAEIALHRFFDLNPTILFRDTLEQWMTETCFRLRNGERKSLRTDLILRPIDCRRTRYRIIELKLPSAPVFVDRRGLTEFSAAVHRAVEQVRRYRAKLTDPASQEEVRRVLKETPADYDLAVIIGMRSPAEPEGLIQAVQDSAGYVDVQIVRYNELRSHAAMLAGPETSLLL